MAPANLAHRAFAPCARSLSHRFSASETQSKVSELADAYVWETPIASGLGWYGRRRTPVRVRIAIGNVLMVTRRRQMPGAHDDPSHNDQLLAAGNRSQGEPEGPRS